MLPSAIEFQYFLEVASSLNLSRASERLGVSQPSLSLAIKRLEQSIGTTLFIRHQHGVALTQSGRQLLIHVRQLLQYWQDARAITLASKSEVQGSYKLGCHSTIAVDIVSGVLPNLLQLYPKLEIHLVNDASRRIVEQIVNFKIDIGIIVNPIRHPDLIITKLCRDEMTFWRITNPSDIHNIHSGKAIILCDPDLTQSHTLIKKCRETGIVFGRILTINSLEVIASLTANGAGIGILPTLMTKTLYPTKLKKIPDTPVYSEEICLVWRNENRNILAIQTIAKAIKKHCQK